ncbi:MAG TPA: SDR family NAD(P)-dependent oxidoreductase [Caulobacteraceae bacterium]
MSETAAMARYPELAGRVAVVTGAGRLQGLGAAMARRLAGEGCRLLIHDLGHTSGETAPAHGVGLAEELEQVAALIRAQGGTCATFVGDMLVEDDVRAMIAAAVAAYGRLDILINNAGIGYLVGPIVDMTQAQWDAVLGVNLRGCFFGIKHAGAQMIAQGDGGRIISIASQAAKSGFALMSAYVASKHGLIGLTRSAAIELGKQGITVNALCPNHVPTDLGNWQRETLSARRGLSMDDYWKNLRDRVPLGRPGAVEDIANACAFLCSDQASYITGEAMNVSGGEEYH